MILALLTIAATARSRVDTVRASIPVAIERRFAMAAHLRIGDTVTLTSPASSQSVEGRVTAIYQPRPDPATIMRRDLHVRMHLADLAALLGQPDRVDRIGVALRGGVDTAAAGRLLNRTAFGYSLVPSRQLAAQSSTTFVVVSRFHRAIAFISLMASAIFLLCLMLLKVEARRHDVAMLRFTGISRRTIFIALMLEAGTVALTGSLVGGGLAILAGAAVNHYYQHAYQTQLIFSEITSATWWTAFGLSVMLGVVVGAVAAWRLLRTAPITLWRRPA